MLDHMIDKCRRERKRVVVREVEGDTYVLLGQNGNTYRLTLEFFELECLPQPGDMMYLSKNMVSAMNEQQFSYAFSARYGMVTAREPHDFLIAPDEFLIVEYTDGTMKLLEQQYG